MVCFADPRRRPKLQRSATSPYPMLLLPPDADAANEMIQALWESGIGLSAVVPATRENIAKELPWLAEPKQAETPVAEATVFHPLTLWLSGMLCGLLTSFALVSVHRWAEWLRWL